MLRRGFRKDLAALVHMERQFPLSRAPILVLNRRFVLIDINAAWPNYSEETELNCRDQYKWFKLKKSEDVQKLKLKSTKTRTLFHFCSHIGCSGEEGSLSIPESVLHPPKDKTGRKETPTVLLHKPLQGLPPHLWSSVNDSEHCHRNAALPRAHGQTQPIPTMRSWKTELSSSLCACGKTSPCPMSASLVAHQVAASLPLKCPFLSLNCRDHKITICRRGLGQASTLTQYMLCFQRQGLSQSRSS